MRAGNLYHKIAFYAKVITRDAYGASSDSWPLITINTRGEIRDVGGVRTLNNEEKFYSKSKELTVRYNSNIVETMKIQIDGSNDLWFITYMEILGRNEGIKLTIEKCADGLSTVFIDPPTLFSATFDSETDINLAWTNNIDGDAISIERSIDGNNWSEIHRTVAGITTYTDTYLSELTRYFYRIRHFKYYNYSAYSTINDATTDVYILPSVPTGLVTEYITDTAVKIDWDNMGADAYQIWESETENGTYIQLGTNLVTNTYTHTVIADSIHWYKVRSVRNVPLLYSSFCDPVESIPWSAYWLTRTPSTLTLSNVGYPEGIKLDWTNAGAADVDGTSIERSADGITYEEIDTVASGLITYTDSTAVFQTEYYYRVRCYKGTNYSPYSNVESLEVTSDRFIITVDTTKVGSANDTFVLPTAGEGTYNYFVDWGDGGDEENVVTNTSQTHVYAASGTYQIKIRGTFPQIFFNNVGDKDKLMTIDNWGNIIWSSMRNAFYGCSVVQGVWIDVPNTAEVTNMSYMFRGCTAFNHSVANFNTAKVTTMYQMFRDCAAFNQSLANFNTAEVTNMSYMFRDCAAFNQSLANFNTAKVTDMSFMFYGCTAFNHSVANFNTAAVTNMNSMFRGCTAFKQSLATFIMTLVTNVTSMLQACDINDTGTTTNYDATLVAWAAQDVPNSLNFHGGTSNYSVAGGGTAARASLEADDLWTITDGGISWSSYWSPQTAVVENAAPADVVLTYAKAVNPADAIAGNFTVAGKTINSATLDGTGKILTLVVDTAFIYGDSITVVANSENIAVTNNINAEAELTTYITGLVTPLSLGQRKLLNEFIKSLKTGLSITNLSDTFDGLYVLAAETEESSLKNLVKDAHHGTVVNASTFMQYEGHKFNGNNQYFNTNFVPSTDGMNVTTNDASYGIYVRKAGSIDTIARAYFGANDGTNRTLYVPRRSAGNRYTLIHHSALTDTLNYDESSVGVHIINLPESTGETKLWVNKANTYTQINSAGGRPSINLSIAFTTSAGFSTIQASIFFFGKSLTQTNIENITDIFEAYMDGNGKGVIP